MNPSRRTVWLAGLVVALLLGGVASYYASGSPDGLNRVASDHGFSDTEKRSATSDSPLAGYRAEGVDDDRLAGGLAGLAGTVLVLVVAGGLVRVVRRRRPEPDSR